MSDSPDQIKAWIRRFQWWWRYLFTPLESEPDIAYSLELLRCLPTPFRFHTREHGPITILDTSSVPEDLIGPALRVFGMTRRYQELSARYYETFRRLDEGLSKQDTRPWTELSERERASLESRWPDEMRPLIHVESLERPEVPPYFTDPQYHSWNLKLADETLLSSLKEFLKSQRAQRQITKPKPNQGIRHHSLSWRRLECFDLMSYSVRVLNESESSAVSQLRKSFEKEKALGSIHLAPKEA